jgi:hypothetical protein
MILQMFKAEALSVVLPQWEDFIAIRPATEVQNNCHC